MTSTAKANIKAIVKLANGQQSYTLEALSQLKLAAGAQITLVDQVSGKAVTGLFAKRKGNDLVLELEGQGEVASLVDFYTAPNVAFYPSGEIPASAMASGAGAVTAQTTTAVVTAAGEPVVWKAPAEFGSMGWLTAGGAGLAAAGGGGGAATAVVVVNPAVLVGNFVMGPVLESSGLVATVYDAAGTVLGVAKIQSDGSFKLTLQQPYTGAVLVVVTDENGTAPDYWDEATGAQKDLTVALRAMTFIDNGQEVNVNVNVFTEAAVRELAALDSTTLPQGVTAVQIAVANDKVKNALGLVDDLVTGAAPVAVVTNTGAANLTANDYGKLLAAASGVDEAGSTEATIQSLRSAVVAANPVLSTSILLLAGATNVADKVPSFLTESQMSLSDYFFIADAINALRTELTGTLSLGDLRTIKALSDQLNTLSGALTTLGSATGVEITALQAALGVPNTATQVVPSNATGLYLAIETAVSAALVQLVGDITDLKTQITANGADITALAGRATTLEAAVTLLNNSASVTGSVKEQVATAKAAVELIITNLASRLDTDIADLKTQIDANGADITALAGRATTLQAAVTLLNNSASVTGSVKEQIATAKTAVELIISNLASRLDTDIADLKTQIDANGADITALAGRATTLETAVTLLNNSASVTGSVKEQVATAKTAVELIITNLASRLDTDIADLKTQIDANGADITALAGRATTLETAVTLLNNSASVTGSVKEQVATAKTAVELIITNLASRLDTDIADLKTQIDANGADITALAGRATTLETAVTLLNNSASVTGSVKEQVATAKTAVELIITNLASRLDTDIADLKTQIDANGADITALAGRATTLETAVTLLNNSASVTGSVKEQVATAKTAVELIITNLASRLDTDIADLKTQIDANGADITALAGRATTLETAVTLLNNSASVTGSVKEQVATAKTAVELIITNLASRLDTDIADLKTQIDANGADITALAGRATTLETAVTLLNNSASVTGSVKEQVATAKTAVELIISNLASRLDTDIADLKTQIDANGADITALAGRATTLETAVTLLNNSASVTGSVKEQVATAKTAVELIITNLASRLDTDIADLKTQIDANGADITALAGRATTLETAVTLLNNSASVTGSVKEQIATAKAAIEWLITNLAANLDTAAPAITNIAITATNPDAAGAFGVGDVVRVEVSFNEAVLVKGAPTFALDVGASIVQAVYVSGAGSDKLVFEYTLTASQADVNGISAGVNALRLNEGGAVTDAAGNLAVVTSDVISTALVVDNGPLSLSFTAGAIFGSQFNADNVVVGVLNPQSFPPTPDNFVFLSDLNGDGYFTVPDGGIFVDADTFVSIFLLGADPSLVVPALGGERVLFDPSNKLALDYQGLLVVLREDILRTALTFEGVPAVDAYIAANTVPAESVWLYDGASAGETIAQDFLNAIQGRNPADVLLTVTSPLTVAQAAALVEAGFDLTNNVVYALRDYDTTVTSAMLVPGTATVVRGATQVTAIGDELANAMRFTSFDQRVSLRVEAGAGNDTIDAGRGNDTIVGQGGGDTINLTSADNSFDTVVYQTVNDGQSLPVSTVTFSTNPQDYRPGSVLTVTINGVEYSHTVSTKKGDPLDSGTVQTELAAFAQSIADQTVAVDISTAVIGYRASIAELIGLTQGGTFKPIALTVADLLADGSYLVPAGYRVMPADSLLLLPQDLLDTPEASAILFALTSVGAGQRFYPDNSLSVFDTRLIDPTKGMLVMATELAVQTAFGVALAASATPMKVADLRVSSADVLSGVTTDGSTLNFYGKNGQALVLKASGDVEAAIDNNGQVTVITVDYSSAVADWPTATNGTNTTQFTRKLSVTIDGKTISADLVFDQDGKPNPALSVAALKTAIEAANLSGGDIAGKLASVNGVTITGTQLTQLTLTGVTAPVTDTAAPTFKVDAASVDTNGVQQVSRVAFSTNDADYYQGGKLIVKIAGVDVIADMVAGSATDSVQSLLQAIQNKTELVKVIEGVVRDVASLTLTAATEKADPLLLDATQDYQGEQQQATLQLETGGADGAYGSYANGPFTNRGADVYYQGGKAYVNIRGAGSDGSMGTGDDVSVTVDALMGKDAITTSQNLVDAINARAQGGLIEDSPAVLTIELSGLTERFANNQSVFVSGYIKFGATYVFPGGSPTTPEALLKVFTDKAGIASATLNETGTLLTITSVATGTSAVMEADIQITLSGSPANSYIVSTPTITNGQNGTISNPDPVLSQVLQGAELKDGIITLTAKQYGKETFEISDVTLDYQGVKQLASIKLDTDTLYTSSFNNGTITNGATVDNDSYSRGAGVNYQGGKAYVTIAGVGADGRMGASVVVSADMVEVVTKPATSTINLGRELFLTDIFEISLLNVKFENLPFNGVPLQLLDTVSFDQNLTSVTVSDYLTALRTASVVQSAELVDGNIVVTFTPDLPSVRIYNDRPIYLDGQLKDISKYAYAVTDGGLLTSQALVDAINAKINGVPAISGTTPSAAVAPDPVLSQLLSDATLGTDGTITLTAKNAGRETFTVSDVTFDYQGQTQQAKATYSTTDADYYAGGKLSLTVDTTPEVAGDIDKDVTVTADMVAGNAASSILALKTAIEAELQVQQGAEGTPTVITVDVNKLLTTDINFSGYLGDDQFFVDSLVLVIKDGSSVLFSDYATAGFNSTTENWETFFGNLDTSFKNFEAFVTYLDGLGQTTNGFDAGLNGSGNLVINSKAMGADVTMDFSILVRDYRNGVLNPTKLFNAGVGEVFGSTPTTGYAVGSDEVIGFDGRLTSVLSEVSVDAKGVITLTSKDKTEHAFDISKAEISFPGAKQVTEIVFGGLDDDDFYTTDDAGNKGTISISIAGTKVTANMGDTEAATLQSLAARIEALRDGTGVDKDVNIAAAVGTVAVLDDKLVLTAAAAAVDPLKVDLSSFSITTPEVHGDFHKVTIQFSNTTLDSAAILGETLSITLNGLTTQLTVDQALLDGAGSLDRSEYLVGKLLDKVIADHTQAGTTNLDLAAAVTARQANLLSFQASKRGVGLLDVATASVTINDGAGTSQTAALLEVVEPGVDDTPASTSSEGITLNDATGEGKAVTGVSADPVKQTITNPGDNSDLYGDSPLTGTAGVQQDFVNPGFGQDTLNGVNTGFFGDDPSSQAGDPFALGGALSQGNAIEVTMFREAQWNAASANPNFAYLSIVLTFSDGVQSYTFEGFVRSNDARLGAEAVDPALGFLPGDKFATAVSKMNDVLSLFEDRVGRELGSITYDALTRKVTMAAVEGVTVSPGDSANFGLLFDPYYNTIPIENVFLMADGTVQGNLQPGESFDASIIVKSPDGGVGQTFTNPAGGYFAQPDSPGKNFGNPNLGDVDLYGSNSGKYTDTSLNTTSLNGGTTTGTPLGDTQVYGYSVGNNPTDRIDLGNGSTTTDGGTAGKDAGSLTNSTSETDAFVVKTDTTGFAPFEWKDSILTVRSTGGAVADVVNNFQTASDSVALEGELLASTVVGDVNGVRGFVTPTPVTFKVLPEIVDTINDNPKEVSFAWNLPSADIPFSLNTDQDGNRFSMYLATNPVFIIYALPTGPNQFDNLADFVSELNASGGVGAPAFDVRLGDDGKVYMSAQDGYVIGGYGVFDPEVSFLSSEGVAFDLSTTEFGLVDSVGSTIDTAALGFSTEVAAVLNSLFDFDAVLGGTTDNGMLNTTVFAVTAADNANVTAIWAHTQSTTGDNTLDSFELNLLATVNTLGNEFGIQNFMPKPVPVLLA